MLIDLASASIIIFCVGCLLRIVAVHIPALASIEINDLPQERLARVKDRLIVDRLRRKAFAVLRFIVLVLAPMRASIALLRGKAHSFVAYIDRLRRQHSAQTIIGGASARGSDTVDGHSTIQSRLQAVRAFLKDGKYTQAEHACVAIIGLDSSCIPAYTELAAIYVSQKDYEHGIEIYLHTLKLLNRQYKNSPPQERASLTIDIAELLHTLSALYSKTGNQELALKSLKKALKIQENSPKFLNALVELYIDMKQRLRAETALSLLEKANSQNKGLVTLKDRIEKLDY